MSELFQAVTEDRPVWEQADGVEFRKFLGTAAGRKLAALLNFDEQAQNRYAVARPDVNHAYASGFARGFGQRSTSLLALSADLQPQSEEASKPSGADDFADRNAP